MKRWLAVLDIRRASTAAAVCVISVAAAAGCAGLGRTATAASGAVPAGVFSALCEVFATEEGFDATVPTTVLRWTRPIYQTFALRVLHGAGALTPAEAQVDDAHDAALRQRFKPSRVALPSTNVCLWTAATRSDQSYFGGNDLVLELSDPVDNPFSTGPADRRGLFARSSLGGSAGATWYWVTLEPEGGEWSVSGVHLLELSDM